jgi:hypothetical protein
MSKDRKEEEPPEADPRLIDLIDSTPGVESDSDRRGYFTNPFTGESKVSSLPADCEGNSAWQLRWDRKIVSANRWNGVSARGNRSDKLQDRGVRSSGIDLGNCRGSQASLFAK